MYFETSLFLIQSPFPFVCPCVETQRGLQLMKTLQPSLKLAASEHLEMMGRCTDLPGLLSLLLPWLHCYQYPASQMKAASAVCSSCSHTSRLQYRHPLCLRLLHCMSSSSFNKFAVKLNTGIYIFFGKKKQKLESEFKALMQQVGMKIYGLNKHIQLLRHT